MEQCEGRGSAGNHKSMHECYVAQATCLKKASYTSQMCKRRAAAQRDTAAFPGRVIITSCFHKLVGEEAGGGKLLLDAAHGAEPTGRLHLEVPMQAPRAGDEAALPWDGAAAGCLVPRSCRKMSTLLRDLLVLQGIREHCRADVSMWKSQRETLFHKSASAWVGSSYNMHACQSGNILEPMVGAASLCKLLLSLLCLV